MDNRRLLLTFVISLGIMFGWTALQSYVHPKPPAGAPATTPGSPGSIEPPPAAGGAQPANANAPAAAKQPEAPGPPEQTVDVVREKSFHAVFTTYGAAPKSFVLLHPQY